MFSTGAVSTVKLLLALVTLLNTIISTIYEKADAETRAKLDVATGKAKTAKTVEEAGDAAQKINDAF